MFFNIIVVLFFNMFQSFVFSDGVYVDKIGGCRDTFSVLHEAILLRLDSIVVYLGIFAIDV